MALLLKILEYVVLTCSAWFLKESQPYLALAALAFVVMDVLHFYEFVKERKRQEQQAKIICKKIEASTEEEAIKEMLEDILKDLPDDMGKDQLKEQKGENE